MFDTVVISINNNPSEMTRVHNHLESIGYSIEDDDVIILQFPDDENGMQGRQAELLYKFIHQNMGKHFIVHCEMGVSRSGAVAKFINDHYNLDDVVLNRYNMYNKRVYRQLMAAAGDSFESYKAHLMELEENDRKGLM